MPNKIRLMLADAIERNGGYRSGYNERWALSYDVALYHADLSQGHIYALMLETYGVEPMNAGLRWNPERQWEWAQEAMYIMLNDTDVYRSYSPATADRYGLTHGEKYFDVTFGLAGRGGKHLVVEEFEGHKLNVPANDLADDICGIDSRSYSNAWCRNLLAMMDEWETLFTSKRASSELEYQAAFQMYNELCDLNREQHERRFWEERDVVTEGAHA